MKGKGKNKSDVKVKTEPGADTPGKPPQFTVPDISKCQTFLSTVRKDSQGVTSKDLVSLQNELEYMYVCLLKRQEQIKTEAANLENPAAKKKRSKSTDSVGKNCAKKSKNCKGNGKKTSNPCRPKAKFIQPPPKSFECGMTDPSVDLPKLPKSEGAARFWSFIEPYCADITPDDIKAVEFWIKSHEDDLKYQNIPELGIHYSEKWRKEDMDVEMKEGSKSVENQNGYTSENSTYDKERIKRMGENESNQLTKDNFSQSNSLVGRLVSTFVRENVMTSLDVSLTESSKDVISSPKGKQKKSACTSSSESLEKKLCKGLSEIGAMEAQEQDPNDYSENEILTELKRLQKALIPVCSRNLRHKKHLLALAKIEMKKQDVKKKLKEIDAKVMETYRAIYAARCANKPPPKKYVAQIGKILADRKKVVEEIDKLC